MIYYGNWRYLLKRWAYGSEVTPYVSRARRRTALWLAFACVLALACSWNAYDAGHARGWQDGYDHASVKEAQAWAAVPKTCPPPCPPCVHPTEFDPQTMCETWLYHRWPSSPHPTFKIGPETAR